MKTELDERGKLSVTAETPIESFALAHWFHLWGERKAVFQVVTLELGGTSHNIEPPQELGGKYVDG